MNGIEKVRLIIWGGTEEEKTVLTDAFLVLLIEHGINIEDMSQWDGWDGQGDAPDEVD